MKTPPPQRFYLFNEEACKEFVKEQIILCNYAIETEQDEQKRSKTTELRDGWIKFLEEN